MQHIIEWDCHLQEHHIATRIQLDSTDSSWGQPANQGDTCKCTVHDGDVDCYSELLSGLDPTCLKLEWGKPLLEWSTIIQSINQMFLGKTSNWMLSVNYDEPSLGVVIIVLNCKSRYGALVRLSFEPQARETMKPMTGTLGEVHFGVSMILWSG